MASYSDLMGFYGDQMGDEWDLPSSNQTWILSGKIMETPPSKWMSFLARNLHLHGISQPCLITEG